MANFILGFSSHPFHRQLIKLITNLTKKRILLCRIHTQAVQQGPPVKVFLFLHQIPVSRIRSSDQHLFPAERESIFTNPVCRKAFFQQKSAPCIFVCQ